MNPQLLIAICSASLGFAACGNDKGESNENPPEKESTKTVAAADTSAATPPVADKAAPASETDSGTDATVQCQRFLDASWTAAQPALALAGIDPIAVESNFVKNKYFIKNCIALAPEALECLSKSESPLTALTDCKTNESVEKGKTLQMSSIFPSAPRPETISDEEQAKRLAAAVGTWKNEFKSFGQVKTWKVSKTGEVKQTSKRNGKDEEPKEFTIKFERPAQVALTSGGSSTQYLSYLPVDARTMFLCNNLSYGAHPVENDKDFVLPNRTEHIVFKDGKCHAVTEKGLIVDAACAWAKEGKVKTFEVTFPNGRLKKDGTPSETNYKYHYIAKHLVDERQVNTSKFVKK